LVERNLAKVEVASSSLVSRSEVESLKFSEFKAFLPEFGEFFIHMATYPSGLRGRSAKPLFIGSNPIVASKKQIR
jgi:hypothetical protein